MPARLTLSRLLTHALSLGIIFGVVSFPLLGQKTAPKPNGPTANNHAESSGADLDVVVRDPRGVPLNIPAVVRLYSMTASFDVTMPTGTASTAHFSDVLAGDYEVEVTCPGYRKTTQHISFMGNSVHFSVSVFVEPEAEKGHGGEPPRGVVMTPQLRSQVQKGLEAMRKKQFEAARKIFFRAVQMAPGNPDTVCFLGLAELGLQHPDLARDDFLHVLSLDPNHELALASLGELQLKNGTPADAIVSLEKAVSLGRAGWRTHFELACAYAKVNRFSDAESEASRAAHLAKEKGATPRFLLGEIQYAEGNFGEAKRTWESVLTAFPADPIVAPTKKMLARLENETRPNDSAAYASPPLPPVPDIGLPILAERPWAPPDIDSAGYDITPDGNCRTDQILDAALHRMKSQLIDFEKFTATEHIEHQEIDRDGWPGPVQSRDFSYIVFVYRRGSDSFYLEESRRGGDDPSSFPTSLATTGLNSLGVSILQPAFRVRFNYSCEGVTNLRDQAAWQVRFEERRDLKGGGFRNWRRNGATYDIPVKGRIWIASDSYAVLRIETDLLDPVAKLELSRDHLVVNYGPVNFRSAQVQLWLPWSADMYMELHGKRYHHKHFLSDYMLFEVDTTHTAGKPSETPLQFVNSLP